MRLYTPTYSDAAQALSVIKSGYTVFVHGSACTPLHLLHELAAQKDRLTDVQLVSITLQGDIEVHKPEYEGHFHINSLFVSEVVRSAVAEGRADFVPVFLSDIPDLFNRRLLDLDVALIQVSPPDAHGYCSLGLSVDIARSAITNARFVIAQVNRFMPRTLGDSMVHISRFTHMVWHDEPLVQLDYGAKVRDEEMRIGRYIAEMIDDGSTLQMGIGTVPDAVLKCLKNHRHLGVHTEMFSDGIVDLIADDVIDNTRKRVHPLKTVTGFAIGTQKLYDYINDNPAISFLDIDFVNDPSVIKLNPKVIAINSAIEVDLTGQVSADSIGTYQYSGIGGQMDFMRGAALSDGGKPIIALTARTAKGLSRIVPTLKPGAGVVTSRGHVHYIITEYGVAFLFGKNLRQRAKALIEIAHPDDREMLDKAFFERFRS